MPEQPIVVGFIGLGQMGQPMAANIARAGNTVVCFDKAGTEERLPAGAQATTSLAEVVQTADTIFLSLPDGPIVNSVAEEIIAVGDRRASVVVDLSTIGLSAAKSAAAALKQVGVTYIDAPVSGGQAGAVAGTITLMWGRSGGRTRAPSRDRRFVLRQPVPRRRCSGSGSGRQAAQQLFVSNGPGRDERGCSVRPVPGDRHEDHPRCRQCVQRHEYRGRATSSPSTCCREHLPPASTPHC